MAVPFPVIPLLSMPLPLSTAAASLQLQQGIHIIAGEVESRFCRLAAEERTPYIHFRAVDRRG